MKKSKKRQVKNNPCKISFPPLLHWVHLPGCSPPPAATFLNQFIDTTYITLLRFPEPYQRLWNTLEGMTLPIWGSQPKLLLGEKQSLPIPFKPFLSRVQPVMVADGDGPALPKLIWRTGSPLLSAYSYPSPQPSCLKPLVNSDLSSHNFTHCLDQLW